MPIVAVKRGGDARRGCPPPAVRRSQRGVVGFVALLHCQVEEIRDTFEMFDVDGSGAIDLDELRECMKELCVPMSEEELQVRVDAASRGPNLGSRLRPWAFGTRRRVNESLL